MASGYMSTGGGYRSTGELSTGSHGASRRGGGQAGVSLSENDHVRWAWGAGDERPRDIARSGKRRQAQVSVTAPGEAGSGSAADAAGMAGGSSGIANASLTIAQHNAMTQSEVKGDLLDVLRMISSGSVSIQTDAPSMTRSQRMVQLENGGAQRSIALQCGLTKDQNNASTQCTESEVMGSLLEDATDEVDNMISAGGGDADGGGHGDAGGGAASGETPASGNLSPGGTRYPGSPTRNRDPFSQATNHSRHIPHSDVPADSYPSFLNEAKQSGVCNRYGFISMPKPPFMLPPRRSVKTIDPGACTHLFAKHNVKLDDATAGRLSRTLQLWSQASGFVPKF